MIERARFLARYLTPHVGRMSPMQLRYFGEHLHPPAYLAVGPFLVLIEIPERFRKADRVPSLEEINAAVREFFDGLGTPRA